MTVFETGENQLRIKLSNTEVIACFGSYEKLRQMSRTIKTALNALLQDIINDYPALRGKSKIKASMTLTKNSGCEITLSAAGPKRHIGLQEYLFEFPNSESLTEAILMLYRQRLTRHLKSSLYKMPACWRLLIESKVERLVHLRLKEFCRYDSGALYEIEHTREHGKPLIINNAIEKYGASFSKGT